MSEFRAATYVRLSRDTPETTSPERQREACEVVVRARGWACDPETDIFTDLDISAFRDVRRPAYESLCSQLDRFDVIVFWRLDRISRSGVGFGQFLEACNAAGTKLVSATEPFDLTTPIGEAMAWIILTFARLESRTIGVRVASAKSHLARNGYWHGGPPPFGWAIEEDGPHSRLVLDSERSGLVREAIGRVLTGEAFAPIVRDFRARGVTGERGGPVGYTTLRRALTSPMLIGHQLRVDGGVALDDDGAPAGRHESLIDAPTYQRLQATLNSRSVRGSSRRRANMSLLGGLLCCGFCGSKMYAHSRRDDPQARYRCKWSDKVSTGRDHANMISAAVADAVVVAAVVARLTPAELGQFRAACEVASPAAPARDRLAELHTALDQLEDDRYLRGLYPGDEGARRFADAHRRLSGELEQLTKLEKPERRSEATSGVAGAPTAAEMWATFDETRRRSLIELHIERIDIRRAHESEDRQSPDRVSITWRGEHEDRD